MLESCIAPRCCACARRAPSTAAADMLRRRGQRNLTRATSYRVPDELGGFGLGDITAA